MSGKGLSKRSERHKWALDYSSTSKSRSHEVQSAGSLSNPEGYSSSTPQDAAKDDQKKKDENIYIKIKKSWDIALGPMKQIPMNLFIMWMAGNSISIFPIMMVGMMFIRPIQALWGIQAAFKTIEGDQALIQRAVYMIGHLAALGLAVYKCQTMGLLPTHPSDWLAFVEPQQRMEWSGGGASL